MFTVTRPSAAASGQVAGRSTRQAVPDKLQQEIEELLARLDTFPPKRPFWARVRDAAGAPFRAAGRALSGVRLPAISAGHLLLFAIAVIVTAYVFGGGGDITRWVIAAGVVLFIAAFILSLRRQSRPPEKLWRGKPMDLHGPGPGDRLRSWWNRWRRR